MNNKESKKTFKDFNFELHELPKEEQEKWCLATVWIDYFRHLVHPPLGFPRDLLKIDEAKAKIRGLAKSPHKLVYGKNGESISLEEETMRALLKGNHSIPPSFYIRSNYAQLKSVSRDMLNDAVKKVQKANPGIKLKKVEESWDSLIEKGDKYDILNMSDEQLDALFSFKECQQQFEKSKNALLAPFYS